MDHFRVTTTLCKKCILIFEVSVSRKVLLHYLAYKVLLLTRLLV